MKIPFNKPYQTGKELDYIQDAIRRGKISGNGHYTQQCQEFFERRYGFRKCLLTTSCTDALEMAAILLDIRPGDEVIVPSFTFASTANAFALRGAQIVFVDSKPDHPNLDESKLEELVTPKTKAIVVVHYAGVPCAMDYIMAWASRHGIFVVEDAAQAIGQMYGDKPLGSIGQLGAFSFHETKNIQCGEGGLLVINDPVFVGRAEIIWEKGTGRVAYSRGEIDKYGWMDVGSSFLPSELNAAYLWAQLENLNQIQDRRKAIWNDYRHFFTGDSAQWNVLSLRYLESLRPDEVPVESGEICLPASSEMANAHMFYLIFPDLESRTAYSASLNSEGILAAFHYQSLHRSEFVKTHLPDQFGRSLPHSDRFSDCLLRLPLFYELPELSGTF